MSHADLLIEIGTEELPTKAVQTLSEAFAQNMLSLFDKMQITYKASHVFATPRRLGLLITSVAQQIPGKTIEHRGPPLSSANGAQGFAQKFNAKVEDLTSIITDKGEYFIFKETQAPHNTESVLLEIINQALASLPIKKPMSWGSNTSKFVRPVHWVLGLFGDRIIPGTLFDCAIGRDTYGHRFLHPTAITIDKPENYVGLLFNQGFVVANFVARKNLIKEKMTALAAKHHLQIMPDEALLDEVTCLVEWPVPLLGSFEKRFLSLPKEVISSTLKQNQKTFVLTDETHQLQPFFITIANIESKDPAQVIAGNEKVVRARLSDAAFFFVQDKKQTLENRLGALAHIVFQQGLGSLLDKSERVAKIVKLIAMQLNIDPQLMAHAGLLCKTDLTSAMVGEFPELQGIIGGYYAHHEKQDPLIVQAIREHYQPEGASDNIPLSLAGCALSIADKLDTLSGVFVLGKKPTGDKDPFALKRAMIGILRIIIEKQLFLDLKLLLDFSIKQQPNCNNSDSVLSELSSFAVDRLAAWLKEAQFPPELLLCVTTIDCHKPYDMYLRIMALHQFMSKPEAISLATAHKRINNLLAKQNLVQIPALDEGRLFQGQEKQLALALTQQEQRVKTFCQHRQYDQALLSLAQLKPELDAFFDHVLVMCEDETLKQNRLALLKEINDLFLQVGDLSYLPVLS